MDLKSRERLSVERAPKHGYNAAGDRVCEVSGSTASLAVSRPGTARIQPPTEQPSARCHCRRRRPASRALIAMRLTPPSLHATARLLGQISAASRVGCHMQYCCNTVHKQPFQKISASSILVVFPFDALYRIVSDIEEQQQIAGVVFFQSFWDEHIVYGTQFTSSEFKDFMQQNKIVHSTIAPGHPATNGLAESAVGPGAVGHGAWTSSLADYAVEFSFPAAESGWDSLALQSIFSHGLGDDIKDEFAAKND
ncbi:unnamed protein product [Pleuronectes platessa]|uniref:Integrase catalytic domain-containing protein n=1 Tax=Pleuronectes platessa TaxID=8262 RepID=A0A9N7Y9Q5_PLEPL|nr:unnamed protein product [Pleuronectes platessa]